jgi:FKBP-type peptidyl-prolyl cis-trans isomerase
VKLGARIMILVLAGCAGASRRAPNDAAEIAVAPTPSASAPVIAQPSTEPRPPAEPVRPARADGLIIEDLVVGKGREVHTGDRVRVHYDGHFEDGTTFDSSRTRGEPATFAIGKGQLIQGWERGVPGMREGGVRRLVVPYDLAYGERGRPPTIPERATLVFEIELIEVLGP